MPSLTSQSLASSTATSVSAVLWAIVPRSPQSSNAPDGSRGGTEARRYGLASAGLDWYGHAWLDDDERLATEPAMVGELAVLTLFTEASNEWRGRSSSRCCLRDSCCSCRRRYFCSAKSRLWLLLYWGAALGGSGSGPTEDDVTAVFMLAGRGCGSRTRMEYPVAWVTAAGRIIGRQRTILPRKWVGGSERAEWSYRALVFRCSSRPRDCLTKVIRVYPIPAKP